MNLRFRRNKEQNLYTQEKGKHKYPPGVVDAFFEVMTIISAAKDEKDFYTVKRLQAKKLQGDRKGQWSVRLNKQWRLTLNITIEEGVSYAEILEIVDYH